MTAAAALGAPSAGVAPQARAAALAVAIAIWLGLAALRFLSHASRDEVSVLGAPLSLGCGFRAAFGFPCPGCGFTRGVVLSAHGDVGAAWALHPAAPLLVFGAVALSFALVALAWFGPDGSTPLCARLQERIAHATLVYGGFTAVVWLVHWLLATARAL